MEVFGAYDLGVIEKVAVVCAAIARRIGLPGEPGRELERAATLARCARNVGALYSDGLIVGTARDLVQLFARRHEPVATGNRPFLHVVAAARRAVLGDQPVERIDFLLNRAAAGGETAAGCAEGLCAERALGAQPRGLLLAQFRHREFEVLRRRTERGAADAGGDVDYRLNSFRLRLDVGELVWLRGACCLAERASAALLLLF